MRIIAGVVAVLAGGLLAIPVVIAGGDNPAAAFGACTEIAAALETIRTLESGSDYTAQSGGSSASGAYQYIDATWRTWFTATGLPGEYLHAYLAPPDVQDQVAAANVRDILANHENRIEAIPVVWYYPAALDDPALMDIVPAAGAGNKLTVREYQTRWIGIYQQILTAHSPDGGTPTGCSGVITPDGEWALPIPKEIVDADPTMLDQPHHDYAAIDLIVPEGTPVYALTSGSVVTIQRWDGNWWSAGCDRPGAPSGCKTCGNGITIQKADGLRHTYCHLRSILVADGAPIAPGQYIGDSGNTGRSGTPHLHVELRLNGARLCPQPLLAAIYANGTVNVPASGSQCWF